MIVAYQPLNKIISVGVHWRVLTSSLMPYISCLSYSDDFWDGQ